MQHHSDDQSYLAETIALAASVLNNNEGGPFAAMVVRDGVVLGRGWNRVTSTPDPTAHAEITAIRAAALKLGTPHLTGSTLYTSCEPCPMCLAASYWAHVDRIIFAASRHRAAASGFDDAFIYQEFALPTGQRRIPMLQQMEAEGSTPFDQWDAKTDKTPY